MDRDLGFLRGTMGNSRGREESSPDLDAKESLSWRMLRFSRGFHGMFGGRDLIKFGKLV